MKKILIWAILLSSIMLGACTSEEDTKDEPGSIYGIVTKLGTAEPMKAIGVELYKKDASSSKEALLLKTVTFDDGHFEFKDLKPENYQVKVVADGYEQTEEGYVTVEAGRQARIDLQIKKLVFKNHMVVRTVNVEFTGSKVTLSGNYTYEEGGDYAPSEVGFVYANQDSPKDGGTVLKCKVDDETKAFSTIMDNLAEGVYYVQAYAKNKIGTEYGEVRSFTISGTTVVVTLAATDVSTGTATLNGKIEAVGNPAYTEKGFVYNKDGEPTVSDTKAVVSGTGSGEFSYSCAELSPNTTYYVRAYAIQSGKVHYGTTVTFSTDLTATSVSTSEATNVTSSSATLNGAIIKEGSPAYSERGFCYSTSPNPTISNSKKTVSGTGEGNYTANIDGLSNNTTYYYKAYAIQKGSPVYGPEVTFVTGYNTVVMTLPPVDVSAGAATLKGRIESVGNPAYTQKGFCYNMSGEPTVSDIKAVVSGTGSGDFSYSCVGLASNTTYYVRAFAVQGEKVHYGTTVTFSTNTIATEVSTSGATNVTPSSATLNGAIIRTGSPAYSERGFCYSTSPNPSISSAKKIVSGTGEGNFSASITGLAYNTTYYYKAYAIQNGVPIYGSEVIFNSGYTEAVVETSSSVTDIKYESAKLSFIIKKIGDPACTEAGICYSTSSNPTIYSNKIKGNVNTYTQKISVTDLQENTTYYYRAYVIQDGNAVYGTTLSFKTATRPSVSTLAVSNLHNPYGLYGFWSVQLNGKVNSIGNPTINGRGFKYSKNGDPESAGTTVSASGSSAGNYSASLSQLDSNTTYYVRAYVKNSLGYEYGELITFTTGNY